MDIETHRQEDEFVNSDKKGIWGWMLFDFAAQPYHTLIITFIFAPYFASFVASDPVTGQSQWGYGSYYTDDRI